MYKPASEAYCNECKKTNKDVRLYRPYGRFYRIKDNHCNEHVPEAYRDVYVPLIMSEDGNPWGYTSVPQDALEAWYILPEANYTYSSWMEKALPGESHWQKI